MARTTRDEGTNSVPGGPGTSTAPNLGAAQQSSNAWLGISDRIESGTPGARPNSSHASYGGDLQDGELFKGTSVDLDSSTAKQLNAGNGEKSSASTGQYGAGSPNYLAGGYGSRENMTIGGDGGRGQYVGDGVGSTGDSDVNQFIVTGKIQMPKDQLVEGSGQARSRNMAKAQKGLG